LQVPSCKLQSSVDGKPQQKKNQNKIK